jgi:hypothetical protein
LAHTVALVWVLDWQRQARLLLVRGLVPVLGLGLVRGLLLLVNQRQVWRALILVLRALLALVLLVLRVLLVLALVSLVNQR